MDKRANKKRWLIYGGIGSALLGLGLCCVVESGFLKHGGEPWWVWAPAGTFSLCLVVAGVVFLIRAGILGQEFEREN